MFARYVLRTTARNWHGLSCQILMTQHNVVLKNVHCQALHTKVFDKHAGFNEKREANSKYSETGTPERVRETKSIFIAPNVAKSDEFENNNMSATTDPDIFDNTPKYYTEDKGDLAEDEYISRPTRNSKKLRTKEYAIIIKEHLNNHRIKDALDVLETRMLKEDRVKPENYIYNLLISGCAKAGYTRKAFQLFSKMRQRGLKVKESTYTSLFNACANAPTRLDGLTRADRLRDLMLEKAYEPNVKNYNAMIKAYGRWGDVKNAYLLADEMATKRMEMDAETYNFLLQACASDAEYGFRHCLITWHKMLKKGIQPDYYSFSSVLRCTRDCGFGDLKSMQETLESICNEAALKQIPSQVPTKVNYLGNEISSLPHQSVESIEQQTETNALEIHNESKSLELPNLLALDPHLGSMVSLADVVKPHERFLLVGGLSGFLMEMKLRNITPNIEAFTLMLEVIPPTNAAEKQLLTYIRKIGLKADIDFFNILIKKRAMRFDYDGGKEVLSMIRTAGLYPDIVTYGVLALGCTTVDSAHELMQQMKQSSIRFNVQILGAMLRQGCAQKAFPYLCEIMQITLDESIKPNHIYLRHLDNFYTRCAREIDVRHPWTKTKSFKKEYIKFCDKYRMFQDEFGIAGLKLDDAIEKLKERPYQQYKEHSVDECGVEPLKNDKLSKKQKLRKYIKKIKIQDLKDD